MKFSRRRLCQLKRLAPHTFGALDKSGEVQFTQPSEQIEARSTGLLTQDIDSDANSLRQQLPYFIIVLTKFTPIQALVRVLSPTNVANQVIVEWLEATHEFLKVSTRGDNVNILMFEKRVDAE